MRVLVVADLHAPCMHRSYPNFLADTYGRWKCNKVVVIGDVADNHMCSTHLKEPDALSPAGEVEEARSQIGQVRERFEDALVCVGNHDERPAKRAAEYLMPSAYLRPYAEVWETPGWTWGLEHIVDDVLYVHGTGSSGKNAALLNAQANMMSVVQGHTHAFAGVQWYAGPRQLVFGLNVGCGLDPHSYAARYGVVSRHRPVLGCGVVIDGEEAYFVRMDLGRKSLHKKRGKYG